MAAKAKKIDLDDLAMGSIAPRAPGDVMPPEFYSDVPQAGLGASAMVPGGVVSVLGQRRPQLPDSRRDLLSRAIQRVGGGR